MWQLHKLDALAPLQAASLSDSKRDAALRYLMFVKKKRGGSVKGRDCADGRQQRAATTRSNVSSPTIATESVFFILVIASKKNRENPTT